MATATLHMDMWDAGGRLMQAANPEAWEKVVAADRIARDNAVAVDSCAQAAVKAGKAEPCKVLVRPR
jgi:hypothetical protein